MCGLDQLLTTNTEALKNLPLEKRATIAGGLPDELKIKDIATLAYPEDKEKQESFCIVLVSLCKSGELDYYGNIEGWEYWDNMPNPYPKADGNYPMIFLLDDIPQKLYAYSDDCLIHKDNLKRYFQNQKMWPVGGLLGYWWLDELIESVTTNDNPKPQGKRDQQISHIIKIATQLGFVDLLNIPEGGKADIKTECLKVGLFTDDGFKKAWIEANKRGLICIENKEKYLSNQ